MLSAPPPDGSERELPAPPPDLWRIIGPGVVAAGVGLSSGEFILWPYIAAQAGLVFLWGAVLGVVTQFFLNMEIERYTLATGETALSGFNRFWRHWGLVFAVMVYFANLWPGWALSAATLATYVFGGNARVIAAAALVIIGAALTLAPVVYIALERLVFVKMAAVLVLGALAVALAIDVQSWRELPRGLVGGQWPDELSVALLMGAIAFAGAGGGQNLCQSNWIRDKGFGMGHYVPRLVSPVTGVEGVTPGVLRFTFRVDDLSLARWRRWWRFANVEQAITFVLVTVTTICLSSMLAHSTLAGVADLPTGVGFLRIEGERLHSMVAPWFGVLFWAVGAFSLFASSMGVVDYTSRLAADVLKTAYLQRSAITESRLYFRLVWGLVVIGCVILLLGSDQPLPLLVISACVGGTMMCLYSVLLLLLNRRELPSPLRIGRFRVIALVWSTVLFGALAVLTIGQQIDRLGAAAANTPRVERLDPALDRLIAADAKVEVLADGFDWSEGPVWVKAHRFLLFSDVPRNVILRWKEGEGVSEWLKPSGYTGSMPRGGEPGSNGLTLDSEGHLLIAQHGDRRIARLEAPLTGPAPRFTTVAGRFQGARFNSPNDLVVHSNGDVYFTDPPYGLVKGAEDPAREIPYQGVFRRARNGEVSLLTAEMTRPNGLALSPDEKLLYVAQSDPAAPIWRVFEMTASGIGPGRVFFDAAALSKSRKGLPDGLKIDVQGNLFATGPGGVLVLSPQGKHLGTILTGEATGNCAFGDDGQSLYITADMYLMRVRLKTRGYGF